MAFTYAPDFVTPTPLGKDVEGSLTVEEFLRRAATSTKRYSTRRRKKPKQPQVDELVSTAGDCFVDSDSRDPDYCPDDSSSSPLVSSKRRGHQIVWTSDEDDEPPEKPPKKRRRRQKKTQSLSSRLLAAAVVTGVDVVGGILLRDTTTGPPDARGRSVMKARRPLPFVPGNCAPSPEEKFKSDRRHLVDPRNTAPFEHAHFDFARRLPIDSDANGRAVLSAAARKAPRPITAWKPVHEKCIAHTGDSAHAPPLRKAPRAPVQRFVTAPLKLVPAADCSSVEER
ncbi:hypothetical protein C8T65DRAFT_772417 [Cerioporus squamosus]|nr:hypothetical protein C8T65DRAFT_772417 [Cerioporus squamosus]